MEMNWDRIRARRLANEGPPEWPEGVFSISIEGTSLLGIHETTNKLYWDGKELVTRRNIKLGTYERWIASFAALGTFGTFCVNAGRALGWWA